MNINITAQSLFIKLLCCNYLYGIYYDYVQLAGMLVTYFLVIVQFASASSVLSAQYSATINSTLIYPDTWQH